MATEQLMLSLHVVPAETLPMDPDWIDSDDEEEDPDESIFEDALRSFEVGSEEYEEQKAKLMVICMPLYVSQCLHRKFPDQIQHDCGT
jgi:hypothetical protein